jgi:hypothetical protein
MTHAHFTLAPPTFETCNQLASEIVPKTQCCQLTDHFIKVQLNASHPRKCCQRHRPKQVLRHHHIELATVTPNYDKYAFRRT